MAQEKVKPAVADGYLRSHDFRSFKSRNTSVFNQMPGYSVVEVSMKHNRLSVFFDCHTQVSVGMGRPCLMHEIEHASGQKKLSEPARIGKISPYVFSAHRAFHNKSIGSGGENPFFQSFEKFHDTILPERWTQNHSLLLKSSSFRNEIHVNHACSCLSKKMLGNERTPHASRS
jgi:hypothetical protein